jgi:hypothetical protein
MKTISISICAAILVAQPARADQIMDKLHACFAQETHNWTLCAARAQAFNHKCPDGPGGLQCSRRASAMLDDCSNARSAAIDSCTNAGHAALDSARRRATTKFEATAQRLIQHQRYECQQVDNVTVLNASGEATAVCDGGRHRYTIRKGSDDIFWVTASDEAVPDRAEAKEKIVALCIREWPDNYVMRKFCIEHQTAAAKALEDTE